MDWTPVVLACVLGVFALGCFFLAGLGGDGVFKMIAEALAERIKKRAADEKKVSKNEIEALAARVYELEKKAGLRS